MKKTALALTIVLALLVLTSAGLQFVRFSSANFFPVPVPSPAYIIKSDGSVDPSLAPIQRAGNIYTLTSDIVGYTIAVEGDDVVLDGAGYTLTGVGTSTGIFVKNSRGVTIRNMKVANFTYGIRFFAEDFMSETSSDNTLTGNTLENNEYGIYLSASFNNVLKNNQMNNNKNNFWIRGGYISETENGYTNDVDTSNTINGKPIIYWINQSDKTVPSDAGFVALVNCDRIIAQDLNLANNGDGLVLVSTANSQILRNHVAECGTGIYLYASQYNEVKENTLEKNGEGIRTEVASDNNIASNDITENGIGIYSSSSNNIIISENTITLNTEDGLNLQGVQNTTIRKNRIADNNQTGINIFDSRNNEIVSNSITGTTGNGIKFWYQSTGNKVLQNQIAANGIGVLIADSYENSIIGNNLTENRDWGLRLEGDQNNNVIYQNNFSGDVADGLPVSIPGVWYEGNRPGGGNVWDNGTTGNYWSDYTRRYANASEIGSSGIWNTPYYINENNMDRYPLVKPFEASEADGGVPEGNESYDWTMFKGNAERNGFTDSPAPENNQVFWKFQTGGPVTESPAVADVIVFVSSTDGYLYAVNAESGSKLWSVQLGSGISSPAIASGKVFVTCRPGEIVALDMYSGTQVWRQPLGEEAGFGSPLVVGSRVFANGNQTVHVFNTEVGANLYNVDVNSRFSGGIAPLARDADLILALMGRVSEFGCNGFEAADGTGRLWVTIGPSAVDSIKSGPAVSEGRTYTVSVNPEGYSTVYALEAFGMRSWEQPLAGITEASPAVAYGLVYIPTDKNAYALNATDGSVEWSFPVNGESSISSPAVADGKVFFGLDNGYIYALDAHTGSLIWDCRTGGAVQSSPAISNGLLFVGSHDGYLYAIGRQSNVASDSPLYLMTVAVSIAFAVGVGLLVYLKKRHGDKSK
jgi:parallel beta-helix repeat protein